MKILTQDQKTRTKVPRIAYVALICGGLIAALSFGTRASFGLYLDPISQALNAGREPFSLAIAIQMLVWGVSQPFAGALSDRFGPFIVITTSSVLYIAGVCLMAMSTTPAGFIFSAGMIIGIALAGNSIGIILGAIGQIFPDEKRAWALGVAGAGASAGQFIFVPYGQLLLEWFGWSGALWAFAITSLVVLPLALPFRHASKSVAINKSDTSAGMTTRHALKEAFRLPSFWFLTGGFFVCGFHVFFIGTHLPAYVKDLGLPVELGAWAISLVGLFNIVGSFMAGILGSRFSKKYLLSINYLLRAVLFLGLLMVPPSQTVVLIFAALLGFLWLSTVPLTSALVGDIFGVKHMTMLYGIVFLSHQIGGFLGAWLGGAVYDAYGSYDIVWWIAVGLGVFSSVMHWPIKEKRLERLAPAQ